MHLIKAECCFKSIMLAYDIVNGPSNINVIKQSITVTKFFFYGVCLKMFCICLVIVMSCTFDTTFKELVASSKTLQLSSR